MKHYRHDWHFTARLYNKNISTPIRHSENEAWRDIYNATRDHDAHLTSMCLVHDIVCIGETPDEQQ